MDEQVFKPLGMTHTQVANGPRSAKDIPGYAYGFVYSDSLKKRSGPIASSPAGQASWPVLPAKA